ncbi:ABC-three component system middle component 2 [Shewanella baltica]|uniref:ABC-three component system middle component 2 n=1 Tax=Shewanella baltica TaxID=62322 RepID=UPI00217DBBFE|nr:ABC-three component system middle component 2 [Shewanella baltica]MCS6211452.1 threonine transporter [Shewanella baltica]
MTESHIFNSSLEAGVRAVSFLNSHFPDRLDFEHLMFIDYVLVNSADFDGPESLHPKTPNRHGELSSRREVVRDGLDLMKRFGLIEIELSSHGVFYRATEEAEPYLCLMREQYSLNLKKVASWLSNEVKASGFERLNMIVERKVF